MRALINEQFKLLSVQPRPSDTSQYGSYTDVPTSPSHCRLGVDVSSPSGTVSSNLPLLYINCSELVPNCYMFHHSIHSTNIMCISVWTLLSLWCGYILQSSARIPSIYVYPNMKNTKQRCLKNDTTSGQKSYHSVTNAMLGGRLVGRLVICF